ncbi:oxidoreductase [Nocardia goodfellowii]
MSRTTPWTVSDIPDLRGRTAVVTGANAGLGLATARMLAEHGARVVLACRDIEKATAAAQLIHRSAPAAELPIVALDLAAQKSVRTAAAKVRAECDHIDLLINNAGSLIRQRTRTEDRFETTFATNHLGPFAFTGLLLDLLLAAPAGRVVTVSSGAARFAFLDLDDLLYQRRKYRPLRAYGASKLANLLFTFELQRRLNGTDATLRSLAAQPGMARTDFGYNMGAVLRFLNQPRNRWMTDWMMQSPDMGALSTLRAAVDPTARGGDFYGPPTGRLRGYPTHNQPPSTAADPDLAAALWATSQQLTGVTYTFD